MMGVEMVARCGCGNVVVDSEADDSKGEELRKSEARSSYEPGLASDYAWTHLPHAFALRSEARRYQRNKLFSKFLHGDER